MGRSSRQGELRAPLSADAKHPPARLGDKRRSAVVRDRGAIRVNARRTRLPVSLGVNAPVLEHVPDCVRGLPRRGQKVRVVAIGEHGAGAVHQLVEGARHPHLEPLHRAAAASPRRAPRRCSGRGCAARRTPPGGSRSARSRGRRLSAMPGGSGACGGSTPPGACEASHAARLFGSPDADDAGRSVAPTGACGRSPFAHRPTGETAALVDLLSSARS